MKKLLVALLSAFLIAAPTYAQNGLPGGPGAQIPNNGGNSGNVSTTFTSADIPAALGWDSAHYPITPSLIYQSGAPAIGNAGITPEAFFDTFSTARSAPGSTFFVSTSGSDGANCLTLGTQCASTGHAQALCNAAGLPCTIFVSSGLYTKGLGFTNFNSVFATVDTAYIATGALAGGTRTTMCICDAFAAPSKDGTQTNTYSFSLTNVERVVDLLRTDRFGNYIEIPLLSAPAVVNITPGSYTLNAGLIYIQRADGAAVTNANTRIYRSSGAANFYANSTTPVNLFVGGASSADGFDLEGGSDGVKTNYTTFTATLKAVVFSNSSIKYSGGNVTTAGNSVSIHSLNGIAAFWNINAARAAADSYNCHNDLTLSGGTAVVSMLTVNSTSYDTGIAPSQSNNFWTEHEDCKGIDIAGLGVQSHGGSVRIIGTSKGFLAGTMVQNDLGDIIFGGTQPGTAYRSENTAVIYGYALQSQMPAGTYSLYATSAASILLRNTPVQRQPFAGAGTLGTY